MKEVKPKKVAGEKLGVKVDDYWDPGKALLQDPTKFLESLFKFDKESIPDQVSTVSLVWHSHSYTHGHSTSLTHAYMPTTSHAFNQSPPKIYKRMKAKT